MSAPGSVPPAYWGVWQRRLLTTVGGVHDTESQVFWLQTAHLHADLRIPSFLPTEGLTALANGRAEQFTALAAQGGFAGLTEVVGDHCQWHRVIDFQPRSERADIGKMHFEGSERVLEDGLDGSYHEVWERLPGSRGVNWGVWLAAADEPGRQGCLLVAGEYFLFAAARPGPAPVGGDLADHLQHTDAEPLLAFELSFGTRADGWRIHHSTLPGRAGQALHTQHAEGSVVLPDNIIAGLGTYPPLGGWHILADPALPASRQISDVEVIS